jgi:dimethylaniline monooxygenase (N-oxide forming)
MDLSYEAIKGGAEEVVVCHRGGWLSFPKVLNDFQVFGVKFDGDLPIDGLVSTHFSLLRPNTDLCPSADHELCVWSRSLLDPYSPQCFHAVFETAYVHPWISGAHVRWFISDFVIKRVLWFMTGTQAGCNQWVGSLPPERLGRAYVFLNKSSKAMPYINRPYQPKNRFLSTVLGTSYIDPPEDANSTKSIDIALWPSHIDETGRVHFLTSKDLPQGGGIRRVEEERMRDRVVRPDMVVYATGYKQEWSWLGEGYPQGPGQVDTREICDSKDLSVGFIGFVR